MTITDRIIVTWRTARDWRLIWFLCRHSCRRRTLWQSVRDTWAMHAACLLLRRWTPTSRLDPYAMFRAAGYTENDSMIHLTDHIRHLWHLARRVPFAVFQWCTLDLSISDAWAAARGDDRARRCDQYGCVDIREIIRQDEAEAARNATTPRPSGKGDQSGVED